MSREAHVRICGVLGGEIPTVYPTMSPEGTVRYQRKPDHDVSFFKPKFAIMTRPQEAAFS